MFKTIEILAAKYISKVKPSSKPAEKPKEDCKNHKFQEKDFYHKVNLEQSFWSSVGNS